MDIDNARKYFLSKPKVSEETPFTMPVQVFKVGDKIFALINIHEPNRTSINLKYPKEGIYELRSGFKEIQPGYHMNKDNWNTVYLDGNLKDDFIRELIDISYELVFDSLTKRQQQELLGR